MATLLSDAVEAIEAEAEAWEALAALRETRVAAVTAAKGLVYGVTGTAHVGVLDNTRIDGEMVRLAASGGCVRPFGRDMSPHAAHFQDSDAAVGSGGATIGTPDTSTALVARWTTILTAAGVEDDA